MKTHPLFQANETILVIYYGDDPTYANVTRPKFLVEKMRIEKINYEKDTIKFEGEDESTLHYYIDRICQKIEELRPIIQRMAEDNAQTYEHQADPTVWRKGTDRSAGTHSALYLKTANQYRTWDFDTIQS